MRYEDARRVRGVESAWLRLKLWFRPDFRKTQPVIRDLGALSDHERRDIGLPEPARYMDWRALMEKM
ncbi:hypothetical protein [Microvirga calopogonii]|uniref:hypothetical protein n=1 Tax=Microvirga calopogonii TaxID=2078013 RepID=UPI000E0CE068|nr:hypothetical protein [Microvirga calopogonii]